MSRKNLDAPPLQTHNNFVELMLSEPETIKNFVQEHLPKALQEGLDLNSLEPQPTHFVEENLRKYVADLLVKAKRKGKASYFYFVVETKSRPEKLASLQTFNYVLKVMLRYADLTKDKPLPMVYPIILYHGRKQFKYTTHLRELIDATPEEIRLLFDLPIHLVDLSQVSDEQLLNETPFPLSFIELVLKHIYDPDLLKTMQRMDKFLTLFKDYSEKFGRKKALVLLHYWYSAGNISDKKGFAKVVSIVDPIFEETVMTLQQAAMNQGARQQQTLIVSRMLAIGEPIEKVAMVSGLSIKEIKQFAGARPEPVSN
jgi:predicted transposase/invertase (TIGR01784 family)